MLLSNKQTIEDMIIEILARNPYIHGPTLVEKVKIGRTKTTKQAVYAALSHLMENEIVHKRGQEYFITNTWLQYINELLNPDLIITDEIFALSEGQSISYRFPNLLSCDKYWAHIFSALIKSTYQPRGVMLWYPHYIFIIGRNKVEREIIEDHTKHKNIGYYSFGGSTTLDKEIKKYKSDYLKINIGEDVGFKQNYFLNIFGDIIVEVFLTPDLSEKIEDWYSNITKPTKDDIIIFENFFKEASSVRMKISKNQSKAMKLKKQLSKNFYIS